MTRTDKVVDLLSKISFWVGPITAGAAVLWAHAENALMHSESYVEAPPTISHTLLDTKIAAPFAWAMIISAVFLSIATVNVVLALRRITSEIPSGMLWNYTLLVVAFLSEAIAIAGMVVLSQYTGNVNSFLHDTGSYMLFFGHAIGISVSGLLIHRLQEGLAGREVVQGTIRYELQLVQKSPRRALIILLLSIFYGVIYFGGKVMPDDYFFWQRTFLSIVEVVVILSFLGYLAGFEPMVSTARRRHFSLPV